MAQEKLTAKIMADRKAGNVPNLDNNRYGHGGHGRGAGSAAHGDDCGKCINCLDKKRVRAEGDTSAHTFPALPIIS